MVVRNKLTNMMGLQLAPGLNVVLEAIGAKLQQIALITGHCMVRESPLVDQVLEKLIDLLFQADPCPVLKGLVGCQMSR